ncbi:hypothetical protein predicted by Glimmer/Critica (plasmid) [Sinorhizobium fredii HH103]|uniref:Uncharacterized protein n=1 Tax=Sinorhizobium fredii (strain HH103) TaxID=1117943 RepID=G9AHA3_SINF1|nr:hypothetical protein predicted by Glimmer/Critica [Sinorhizobium fredii HH103]
MDEINEVRERSQREYETAHYRCCIEALPARWGFGVWIGWNYG